MFCEILDGAAFLSSDWLYSISSSVSASLMSPPVSEEQSLPVFITLTVLLASNVTIGEIYLLRDERMFTKNYGVSEYTSDANSVVRTYTTCIPPTFSLVYVPAINTESTLQADQRFSITNSNEQDCQLNKGQKRLLLNCIN